jgi:hypothetical protein
MQERPTIKKLLASEIEVNDRFIGLPRRPRNFYFADTRTYRVK